jgi:dynein light chain Tctex-type 1
MLFNIHEIKKLIKQVLHDKIGEKEYLYENVYQWNIDILNDILNRLKQIEYKNNHYQQMKYIVTVLIGEKIGLHTALSCLWDGTTDGCVTVKWENKNIFSIINIFGLAI